jgi:hypothetical protein
MTQTAEPITQNGQQEAPSAATTQRERIDIARVIRNEAARRKELDAENRRHAIAAGELNRKLRVYNWLRRCHAAGFDVDRLAHARLLYFLSDDWSEIAGDDELTESLIRQIAERGCAYYGSHQTTFESQSEREGIDRPVLDDSERDAVIYFLANLRRLPPLVEPEPAPEPEPEPLTPDAPTLISQRDELGRAVRDVLAWYLSVPHGASMPDDLFDRARSAAQAWDPFFDTVGDDE